MAPVHAQEAGEAPTASKNHFTVSPAASSVKVDGVLDEEAWKAATVVPLTHEWLPGDNTPPPVRTECLVTFDENQLYVAFRAYDPDPSQIRYHLSDRDSDFIDDSVGFLLDTFNDRRRAFQFRVNPLGIQYDATVSDVDDSEDSSWDAIWDSAGKVTGEGYIVEMAVPFRQLRFRREGGVQTWGFVATRVYPRSVTHELRSTFNDRDQDCRVCQFDRLTGFENLEIGYNLQVVPTITASQTDERRPLDGPLESGSEDIDGGLSVSWGITPNITLNGTVNPDFSQVEADVAQLDVNERFALFFPEKRPFFLEGADYFATPIRAVFTRSVVDPKWGAKVTGKEGRNAFGVQLTEDRINTVILPGFESSGLASFDQDVLAAVLRYRRDVGKTSTLGFLYTGRDGDSYQNHVYGVDGSLRLSPKDTLRFQFLNANTRYPDEIAESNGQKMGSFSGISWEVDYSHATRNWFYRGNLSASDEDFRADSGFVARAGVEQAFFDVRRTFWGSPDTWFSRLRARVNGIRIQREGGGDLVEQGTNIEFVYEGPKQSRIDIGIRPNEEVFRGQQFNNVRGDIRASIRPSGNLTLGLFLRGGEIIDFVNVRQSDFQRVEPLVEFKIGKRISGELKHTYESFEVRGQEFLEANLSQTTLRYHFNVRTFVRAILQFRTVDRDLGLYNPGISLRPEEEDLFTQLLFSYKLNPETVLFLGYSDRSLGNEAIDLTQANRTFFLKVGYAWLR